MTNDLDKLRADLADAQAAAAVCWREKQQVLIDCEGLKEQVAKLTEIVSKLPRTADGVIIEPNMPLFAVPTGWKTTIECRSTSGPCDVEGRRVVNVIVDDHLSHFRPEQLFTTPAAALASGGVGGVKSSRPDSNGQPSDYESPALTLELREEGERGKATDGR